MLGIEDKIIKTDGYCLLITDEGAGFFKDLKNKDSKHESDIVLINQLYDGEGDKVTLAQNKQRVIPANSTSVAISLQQEGYVHGIFNLGSSLWMDSGFSERFMVTAVQPYRSVINSCLKFNGKLFNICLQFRFILRQSHIYI